MGNTFRKTRCNEELQTNSPQPAADRASSSVTGNVNNCFNFSAQPPPRNKNCTRVTIGISIISFIIGLGVGFAVVSSKPQCSPPDLPTAACPDDWIGYRGKCYLFSESEGNWSSGQNHCSSLGTSLAVIDTQKDLNFLLEHKGRFLRWIGLQRDTGQPWRWVNGTELSLFKVNGDGRCAYLNEPISSSRCYTDMKWICSQLDELVKRNKMGDL